MIHIEGTHTVLKNIHLFNHEKPGILPACILKNTPLIQFHTKYFSITPMDLFWHSQTN